MTYFLARKFIAKSDVYVSEESLSNHKKNFKRLLKKYLPALQDESVGRIEFYQVCKDGLWIEAIILETNQMNLKLSTSSKKIARDIENDKFFQFIQKLDEQKDLIMDSPFEDMNFQKKVLLGNFIEKEEKFRREAFRGVSKGKLDFGNEKLKNSDDKFARNLNIGRLVFITARVLSLTAKYARLEKVQQVDESNKECCSFEFNSKINLKRGSNLKNNYQENGEILRRAMDESKAIKMSVKLIMDGITGDVDFLELVEIL